ncbi:conserved hypothetical protein [Crocosphaera subtropica ATCC 51142]|uniref:Uncharacterized protein n=1 Tax=Crocosphaera subtropica (strain ATCC 51142 / BH68) TaxID=43989 RepID=B1X0B9_CROS5|nr:hypothetical protein [Crocosphaera subtropica]ACB49620.1 conserved hypothetical protein [Crocosphaera subtropica ATCC 51142]
MAHTQEKITYPHLPLAVYRELAAHLRQIEGVTIALIPQQSQQFNYDQSQIDHLEIGYPSSLSSLEKQRLLDILDYYAQIHSPYTREVQESVPS